MQNYTILVDFVNQDYSEVFLTALDWVGRSVVFVRGLLLILQILFFIRDIVAKSNSFREQGKFDRLLRRTVLVHHLGNTHCLGLFRFLSKFRSRCRPWGQHARAHHVIVWRSFFDLGWLMPQAFWGDVVV